MLMFFTSLAMNLTIFDIFVTSKVRLTCERAFLLATAHGSPSVYKALTPLSTF